MRPRSFTLNTLEIILPVALAAALAVGAFLFLNPVFGQERSGNPGIIRIYASVPSPGFDSIVHGTQMAIDEVNAKAGDFRIEFVPLSDAKKQDNGSYKWDPDVELANARRAVDDPDAMVYIGTYNSGAAKISIPVLNRVSMAMISPGNTYPGLTKPGTGTAGEPYVYFPLGVRNYFRVVTADDLQGAAAAAYAKQIGAKSVFVLDDTELYGKGIAAIFTRESNNLGLTIAGGPESIDTHASSYAQLATRIVQSKADLVYFGGITANQPAKVLADLRSAGYNGAFMGADGIADDTFITSITGSTSNKNNIYSTLPGLPAAQLTGDGATWYAKYKARYPSDNNEDFASFGYEAGKVAISAIERTNKKDREAIRQAVAATGTDVIQGGHILGDWKFDANGDTSLVTISVQNLGQNPQTGQYAWLYKGIMKYDPNTKQWTFVPQVVKP